MRNAERGLTYYSQVNALTHLHWGSIIQFSKMHHPHSSKTLNNAANKIFIGPLKDIFMLQINYLLCGNLETHCWLHIWKEYNTFSKVSSGYWWIHNPETRRRNNCVHLRLEEWKNDGKKKKIIKNNKDSEKKNMSGKEGKWNSCRMKERESMVDQQKRWD